MVRILNTILFLSIVNFSSAQLIENFSDSDFISNPAWSGDTASFIVNTSQQLQSVDTNASSTFYLSTPSTTSANPQWEIFMNLKFSTSGANYVDVFLISDKPDVNNAGSGFFVRVGGTPDEISLYRNDAGVATKIILGTPGRSQASPSDNYIKLKITRDTSNLWTLTDSVANASPVVLTEGTVTDASYPTSQYFGISVKQSTASFFGKHYFDDIYAGTAIMDTISPTLSSAAVTSQNTLDLLFSEPVEQITAEDELNYPVNKGIGTPATATRDISNLALVHLSFSINFISDTAYTVTVSNIKDLSDNIINAGAATTFTYFAPVTASPGDIIINEIMAAPNGSLGLPNAEYVEIYNRSNKNLNLNGWTLSDATGSSGAFQNLILSPGSFLIICSATDVAALSVYGNAISVTSFPSLNNTGDDMSLYDNTAQKIDEVIYDETWYHDAVKQTGGYSLERIDYNFPCPSSLNWAASNASAGGTPGHINSIHGTYVDNASPKVKNAIISSPQSVVITFNEAMDAQTLNNTNNYSIDNGIGTPVSANAVAFSNTVTLQITSSFQINVIYKLTINGVKDCSGNAIAGNTVIKIAIPDTANASDILINELLFNPYPDSYDFVELYNNSNKVFDLSKLKVANADEINDSLQSIYPITTEGALFFPGDYIALTENSNDITSRYHTTNPDGVIQIANLPSCNDDVGKVVILNQKNIRIDQFRYSAKFHYPLLSDPEGVSLERLSFTRPAQDSTNWQSAAEPSGFATPAYKNSQSVESNNSSTDISITPEIFSPDNDGYNDVLSVHYHFNKPGLVANATVFDSRGRIVQYLARNVLIGEDATLSWNGINLDNEKSKIGIYILYSEIFDTKGDVKHYKNTFVLGGKM